MLYLNFGQVEFKRLKEQVRDVGMNLRNEFRGSPCEVRFTQLQFKSSFFIKRPGFFLGLIQGAENTDSLIKIKLDAKMYNGF